MAKYGNREVIYQGIKFDSVLERNAFMRLEFLGVEFKYHEKTYTIANGGTAKAWSEKTKSIYISKIPSRKYTPEFTIHDKGREIIIEMKGMRTAAFNIRWDLFRKTLEPHQEAYLIKTIGDLVLLVQTLGIKSKIKNPNIQL